MSSLFSRYYVILVCLLVLIISSLSLAATVDNSLLGELESSADIDRIPVYFLMNERPDFDLLRLKVKGIARNDRSGIVWKELQALSNRSQSNVRHFLEDEILQGRSSELKTIHLANAIVGELAPATIAELINHPDILSIHLNREVYYPEDDYVMDELDDVTWAIELIGANVIWADGFTGEGILIAVIDTGVRYSEAYLVNQMWDGGQEFPNHGYDFHNGDDDPWDLAGHGTGVASIIAGDGLHSNGNNSDTTGIAPNCSLMALKVRENLSVGTVTNTWIAQDFCIAQGVDITHMSLGWGSPDSSDYPIWRDNYTLMSISGIVNIKSAGNNRMSREPPAAISAPGSVPSPWRNPDEIEDGQRSGLITVGASGSDDVVTTVSSPGPCTWQDIDPWHDYPYDPENGFQGLIKPDLTGPGSGATSFAAPVVTGVVALLLEKANNLLPVEIDSILQTNAVDLGEPGKDNDYGAGRVDAIATVDAIAEEWGRVSGTIIDENTGLPLVDSRIYIEERHRHHDISDLDGLFSIDIPVGTYYLQVQKESNPVYTAAELVVEEGDNINLDIVFPSGIITIDAQDLYLEVPSNEQDGIDIVIGNAGTTEIDVDIEVILDHLDNHDPWDMVETFDAVNLLDSSGIIGMTFENLHYYVLSSNEERASLVVYTHYGLVTEAFGDEERPLPDGLRGISSKYGEILVHDGTTLFRLEPGTMDTLSETTLAVEIAGPIAWDSQREGLWAHDGIETLYLLDSEGEIIEAVPWDLDIVEMAVDPRPAEGSHLYTVKSRVGDLRSDYSINKYDTESGDLSPILFFNEPGEQAVGLAVPRSVNGTLDALAILKETRQESHLEAFKIRSGINGLSVSPQIFTVQPGTETLVSMNLDAFDLPPAYYSGQLRIEYNAWDGLTTLPFFLDVQPPLGVVEEEKSLTLPEQVTLITPYPNPMNSSTMVHFELPDRGHVKLVIHDLLGREVQTLSNSTFSAGRHRVIFDGRDLASGVYFVSLQMDGEIQSTKKIVLLK